jgi:hypothetical protein
MSDTSEGPGWWLASDGKWYPPESSLPPPPPAAPMAPVAQKTNGLAIASLVLGILWLFMIGSILAIVFGHISLSQIKKSNGTQGGRGMAIAGLVLGYLSIVGWILIILVTIIGTSVSTEFSEITDTLS